MTVDSLPPGPGHRPARWGGRAVSLAFPLSLLLACAAAPRFDLEAPVPATPPSWTAAGAAVDSAGSAQGPWWSDLEDPNLADLIAEGLAHNHDLAAAAARVERAAAQARAAGGGRWPQAAV